MASADTNQSWYKRNEIAITPWLFLAPAILFFAVLIGALAAAPWLDGSLRAMGQKGLTKDSLFLQKVAPLVHGE